MAENPYLITMRTPAGWHGEMWREAIPSGNGLIGTLLMGGVKRETILINRGDLWHAGKNENVPDVSDTLSKARNLLARGEYKSANDILMQELREKGYGSKLASPLPMAELSIVMDHEGLFSDYSRALNMHSGEAMVNYTIDECKYSRKIFVSRSDNIVVCSFTASQPVLSLRASIDFYKRNDELSRHPSGNRKTLELMHAAENSICIDTDVEFIRYSARNDDDCCYGTVARVITDGNSSVEGKSIHISGAARVMLLIDTFANRSNILDEFLKCEQRLKGIDDNYDALLLHHESIHGELMDRVQIELCPTDTRPNEDLLTEAYKTLTPVPLLDRMWRFGRYLFVSGTCKSGLPFPLYGLWHGDYLLPWTHNMGNANIQMIYWHAAVGGLHEMIPAMADYYLSMMDDFKENAKNLFGCRGIFIPAGTTPGIGHMTQIVPVILNWISCAAWLSLHFYEYWIYEKDRDFLIEKALPFMVETALFYEDYFQYNEDGTIYIAPSVSPENTPSNLIPIDYNYSLGHYCPTAINSTMDVAIAKEFFGNLIDATEAVGLYGNDRERWKRIVNLLPEYALNEDGSVREWLHKDFDDNVCHRHLSHIFPVFPGHEYADGHDEVMQNGFLKATRNRIPGAQTGWSLVYGACVFIRLGQAEDAMKYLGILMRSCLTESLFTLHNDWRSMGLTMDRFSFAPVQLDAALGVTNAVQEMIFYTWKDTLKLLPALPNAIRHVSATGLRFVDGRVDIYVDCGRMKADIHAEHDTEISLVLPVIKRIVFNLEGGTITKDGRVYRIKMKKGTCLNLEAELEKFGNM